MVQGRDDDDTSQEVEQRAKELRLIVHLLGAGHSAGHFLSILSFPLRTFIMSRFRGN